MSNRAQNLPPELTEVLTSLGIDPADARLTRKPPARPTDYLALPSASRPRFLVPCLPAAGAMVSERRADRLGGKLFKRGFAIALTSGAAGRMPLTRLVLTSTEIPALLGWLTGSDPATVSTHYCAGVLLGPPRANRKPVLRVFALDGSTWGYAKVGINELTDALIRRETEALRSAARWGLTTIRPPRILKAGTFNNREVLATSALAGIGSSRQPKALPVEPTRELFTLNQQLDVRVRDAPGLGQPASVSSPAGARIEGLAERLLATIGDEFLPLGTAHGDWAPQNMAWSRVQADGAGGPETLDVWDWERSSAGVPQGHDVIHFELSKVWVGKRDSGETEILAALPARLAACGIDPALSTRLLATYLVMVGRRYAGDLALEHVSGVDLRLTWVIDLLGRCVAELESREFARTPHGGSS